jgi:hypothetical protein
MSDDTTAQLRRRLAATPQVGVLMIRCATSGEAVPAGMRFASVSFEKANVTIRCPHCGDEHAWAAADAWVEDVY